MLPCCKNNFLLWDNNDVKWTISELISRNVSFCPVHLFVNMLSLLKLPKQITNISGWCRLCSLRQQSWFWASGLLKMLHCEVEVKVPGVHKCVFQHSANIINYSNLIIYRPLTIYYCRKANERFTNLFWLEYADKIFKNMLLQTKHLGNIYYIKLYLILTLDLCNFVVKRRHCTESLQQTTMWTVTEHKL